MSFTNKIKYTIWKKTRFIGPFEALMFEAVKNSNLDQLKMAHMGKRISFPMKTKRELGERFKTMRDRKGKSLLTYAFENGNIAIVKYLLDDMDANHGSCLLHEMLKAAKDTTEHKALLVYMFKHQLEKDKKGKYPALDTKDEKDKYPITIAFDRDLYELADYIADIDQNYTSRT